jgi:hypothetical protein
MVEFSSRLATCNRSVQLLLARQPVRGRCQIECPYRGRLGFLKILEFIRESSEMSVAVGGSRISAKRGPNALGRLLFRRILGQFGGAEQSRAALAVIAEFGSAGERVCRTYEIAGPLAKLSRGIPGGSMFGI